MKNLIICLLIASSFVGCAKDSGSDGSTMYDKLQGSWIVTETKGTECSPSELLFSETRSFSSDGTTSNGSITEFYAIEPVLYIGERPLNFAVSTSRLKIQSEIGRDCWYYYNKVP